MSSLDAKIHIAVCKTGQFNYPLAKSFGYPDSTSYYSGKPVNKTILTWSSLDENQTFNDVFKSLHNSGLNNIDIDVEQTLRRSSLSSTLRNNVTQNVISRYRLNGITLIIDF